MSLTLDLVLADLMMLPLNKPWPWIEQFAGIVKGNLHRLLQQQIQRGRTNERYRCEMYKFISCVI
jgi:hypothetical protein